MKQHGDLAPYFGDPGEFFSILDASYDGLAITDGEGKTLWVNKAYSEITGVEGSQLVGRNVKDLESEGFFYPSATAKAIEKQNVVNSHLRMKTGKIVFATSVPIKDRDQRIKFVVTNFRDMTELNYLSQQLEQADQLKEKYLSMMKALNKQQVELGDDIIFHSRSLKEILELILKIANLDVTVLLTGETGVGKDVVAKLLHEKSSLKGLFIKVNCGAIPENLLESELFGYEKGAFTGANKEGKIGLFELADSGTLFLDEIGDLSLKLQVKLLEVLQDFSFMRIGGTKRKRINARIISATNKNLEKMVEEGNFREDLYYRLNVIPVHIPPLRERKEDLLPLIHYFVNKYNKKHRKEKLLSREAITCLINYNWPGNVRELSNLIERSVIIPTANLIGRNQLPPQIAQTPKGNTECLLEFSSENSLKGIRKEFEIHVIEEAVKRYGNAQLAAKALRVNPSTISRKLKK